MDTHAEGAEKQTSAQQTVTASPPAERLTEEKKDVGAAKTPADTSQPPLKKAKTEEEDDGEECAKTFTAAELKTLGVRQYLEKTVVPVLQQGMQELVKSRPEDPFEALAEYLQKHNPRKQKNAS